MYYSNTTSSSPFGSSGYVGLAGWNDYTQCIATIKEHPMARQHNLYLVVLVTGDDSEGYDVIFQRVSSSRSTVGAITDALTHYQREKGAEAVETRLISYSVTPLSTPEGGS
jgi:hypothetical protein